MAIIIGEAAHDEHGSGNYGYEGSQKGDQLQKNKSYTVQTSLDEYRGEEVRINSWYNLPWVHIYRPNNESIANEIAIRAEQTVRNPNIGYSQPGRLTYHNAMMKDPDPSHIATPVECDCSSMDNSIVYVTLKAHGINPTINGQEVTAQMEAKYNKMCPSVFTDVIKQVDLKTGKGVKRGDILLGKPATHTAIIIHGSDEETPEPSKESTMMVTGDLWLRDKPITGNKLVVMKKGSTVTLHSTEVQSNGATWAYVTYGSYKGYCSYKYLSNDTNIVKPITRTGTVTTALYLRQAPVNGNAMLVMPQGAQVEILDEVTASGTKWYKVKYNGTTGYCSGKYIK